VWQVADNNPGLELMETDLRKLGSVLVIPPPPDDVLEAVMTRIEREPVPAAATRWRALLAAASAAGRWLRARWRIATAFLAASLLVLLVVTPAGAAVRQWLGFGAVVVEQEQAAAQSAPPPTDGTDPQSTGTEMSLEQARTAVSFPVGVPGELGAPDRVTVSDDRRTVTMAWPDGGTTIRLDQIGGAADPVSVKKYYSDIEFIQLHGREALWLVRPHPIVVLALDGAELVESTRQSGPALVWQSAGATLRLEGVPDQKRAVAIAESVAP
jgi:hypothetical protein